MEVKLESEEFILLQALLQVGGLCDSGGEAKGAITKGKVTVDGEVELRRGKKIRSGQIVSFNGKFLKVVSNEP